MITFVTFTPTWALPLIRSRVTPHPFRRTASSPRVRPVVPTADLSKPPPFHDAAPNHSDNLHWKDRVALYAQFSAEETLHVLLKALQANSRSGPQKDDGIDALYAFANLDIWALSHRFFGRKMDLGQFERFKRVVVAQPYAILLREYHTSTLSAMHVSADVYVTRRTFECDGVEKIFTFTMTRTEFGTVGGRAWMVDSIICDNVQTLKE